MFRFRPWLLCVMAIYILALSPQLGATPPLTTISDTLFNADGTFFNGVVVISWPSFEASDTSNVAAETNNVQINNGILFVQLVPTTNANTAAVYTVQYTSLGVTQFSEAWAVAPSDIPLRVRDVRLAPGSVSGSAPAAATIITIADVTGLQTALNVRAPVGTAFTISRSAVIDATGAIDGAVGNLSDCLHVDGTSGPCSSASTTFFDDEIPSGTINGTNVGFILANVPNPSTSLALYRNGLLLTQGRDYTLLANAITFVTGAIPQPNDVLAAYYRLAVSIPGVGFVDQQTPAGTVNGVNGVFTLAQTPAPTASLAVYRNGLLMTAGVDYTLGGAVITFMTGLVPQTGDTLSCSYRIAQ
ncbi:MAG TPA: hypothetical protein VK708_12835 [Bryobacteraceae bacterium]|jgi:hypothetical protein|nr:hypothetical protein [Bryobacteraceae bacterium]